MRLRHVPRLLVLGAGVVGADRALAQPLPPAPFPTVVPTFVPAWPAPPPTAPTAAPTAPTVVPTTGPFTRGADFVLTKKATAPKTTLLAASTPFPRFAPDGKALLLAGKTTRLGSVTAPLGVVLDGTRAYRSAWSPDSKGLVTSDEDGALALWAVPSGARLRKLDDAFKAFGSVGSGKHTAYEVAFPDPKTVTFHTGCRLHKLDLSTTGATPVALGVDRCGRPQVTKDGKRWVLLEQGTKSYGVGLWYVRASTIDPSTGVVTPFVDDTKVGAFSDAQLSPAGDRLCFVRTTRKVTCATIDQGKIEDVSDAPADRWLGFDNAGGHLMYVDQGGPDRALHWVDFAARSVRRIAKVSSGTTVWMAFTGDKRVVAYGYDGGTIFDLEKGWSQSVFEKSEVEGFAAVPGDGGRAILGKAAGPSRDLYWLTVTD